MRWIKTAALIIVIGLAAGTASAHRPIWGEDKGVTDIPDLQTSFAVYRDLSQPGQVDYYSVEASAGQRLWAGINIPAVRGLEAYGVTIAVFGPGLPPADPALLPADYPHDDGMGAVVFSSQPGKDFFEPFTQTNYWGRQRIDLTLPETGTYYLAVWRPDGQTGKYVMDTGQAEVFGPSDIFRMPVWWVKVHLFFGHGPWLVGAPLAGLSALAAAWWLRRRPAPVLKAGQVTA